MRNWWAVPMMISCGLFTGGVLSISWERLSAWRGTDPLEFRRLFAHTLRRVDKLQPALLSLCLVSTIGFASSGQGTARTLACLTAAGFIIVLVGSLAWLVPIQRRLVGSGPEVGWVQVETLKAQWLRGHVIRTILALGLFILAGVAAVV